MQVKVIRDGPYGYTVSGGKMRAVWREADTVIEVPDWYGQSLISSGMAVQYVPEEPAEQQSSARKRRRKADGE